MDTKTLKQIKNIINEAVKNLATKDEVKSIVREEMKGFTTKEDLKNFATKDDLKNFATKDDLKILENNLKEYTDQVFGDLMEAVEKHKADRIDIERLEKQISSL